MKKMFLGGLLFVSGFISILLIVIISIFNPWEYNGIGGFEGFLLGTDIKLFFIVCCIFCLIGIIICFIEAYMKDSRNN